MVNHIRMLTTGSISLSSSALTSLFPLWHIQSYINALQCSQYLTKKFHLNTTSFETVCILHQVGLHHRSN